jgi:molecular chaperone DnaJ
MQAVNRRTARGFKWVKSSHSPEGTVAQRDYYNILGVSRKATQDEIKKAYRSLAMRWHPDKNPDDAAAEQRFKDINVAYRTLGDPEKRGRYDRLGPLYTEDGRPPRPEDLNEVVGTVFSNISGIFGRRKNARGEDLRYTVALTLEEVSAGTDKEIVVPRKIRCKTCAGDGADPDNGKQKCTYCSGSGRASGPRLFRTDCYHCSGRGFTVTATCPRCSGDGRVTIDDTLVVKVPAGVATGQKLKLSGKGNAARGSGGEGDLLVVVNVAEHPLFRRRGDDVLIELPLTITEATLGADVSIPTLSGLTTIRVPAGSMPGKILRLSGRGLPKVSGSGRGDQHLQLAIEIPEQLTEAQADELRKWNTSLGRHVHPLRARFDRYVEERR